MSAEIRARFDRNLERVDNLIKFYQSAAGPGSGRTSVANTDLLRSAVVFLHATLEDVVRSVLMERWPSAREAELYKRVPFTMGDNRPDKISLGQLAERFGGQTVEDVLRDAIANYLEHSNFNNVDELALALHRAQLDDSFLVRHGSNLEAMMRRRHWIVHRADRNEESGSGQHAALSLRAPTVKGWRETVVDVCSAIVAQLP